MTEPFDLTDGTFDEQVLRATGPVLVEFWAAWCIPCREMAPVVSALADALAGRVAIGKLNVDENRATAGRFHVAGVPAWIFFQDGVEKDRFTGAATDAMLKKRIEMNFGVR